MTKVFLGSPRNSPVGLNQVFKIFQNKCLGNDLLVDFCLICLVFKFSNYFHTENCEYYMLLSNLLLENSPKNVQKYKPVLRFLIDPIPVTLRHLLFRCLILHVAIKVIARKFAKKCAKIWACNRIINWSNIYHRCLILHVAINFIAEKFTKKCANVRFF